MNEKEKKWPIIYDLLNAEIERKTIEIVGVYIRLPSSLNLNPLDYTILGVFEKKQKKPKATYHRNIDSLKTATE